MARGSSPLPMHSNAMPRTSTVGGRTTIHIDDGDELIGDTIPCSPAAFLRDTTQPTQILQKPTLGPMRSSSPASSIIEVPASSPFQQPPKRPTNIGTRLAPAGTVFCPPQRSSATNKRPAMEPISLVSDDEDDLTPPRGDIRPTTFKAQISAFAYNPLSEMDKRDRLREVYDVLGNRVSALKAKEALVMHRYNVERTVEWLEKRYDSDLLSRSNQPPTHAPKPGRRLISKGQLQSGASTRAPSRALSQTVSPSPQKKPRRRLVQGRRNESAASSQETLPTLAALAEPPSSDDPLVINLIDDKEDAYQAEASPDPGDDDDDDEVLKYINTSTIQELAAMTGMKEARLECVIEKRPFDDISKARRVAIAKKPGARKSARVSIGETVVDAVEVFLNAVTAIDDVVAKCEADAKAIKAHVEAWDIDVFGHDKRSRRQKSEDDLPPTPTSISTTKYVRPPIPRQPEMMNGHCEMKPFQLVGLNWMSLLYNFNIGCILADEMGLGKTCQVISLMCHLVEQYEKGKIQRRPWPNLIVVPPSTYNNWLGEFEKFAPDLSVIGYRGSQSERAEIAYEVEQEPEAYHVVLATYSQINNMADVEAMQSFDLRAAIFDEGHKMKNPETKIYKDLSRIPSSWKMLLTGMFTKVQ